MSGLIGTLTVPALSTSDTIELAIDCSPPAASNGLTGNVDPTGGVSGIKAYVCRMRPGSSELKDLSKF